MIRILEQGEWPAKEEGDEIKKTPEKQQTKEQFLETLELAQDKGKQARITLAEIDENNDDYTIVVTIKGFYGHTVVTQLANNEIRDIDLAEIEKVEIIG